MAYYSTSYMEDNTSGEYQRTPYYTSYDIVPFQDSQTYTDFEAKPVEFNYSTVSETVYSSYDFSQPKLIEYSDSCNPYYATTNSEMNYSVYRYSQPNVIEYDPSPYQTQYFLSHKTVTFKEPISEEYDPTPYDGNYDEYDPTPYDGGYDQTVTYGKPLPPSDQICYPRSSVEYKGSYVDGFSYNLIPSPYGKHDVDIDSGSKPIEESKPADGVKEKQPNGGIVVDSTEVIEATDLDKGKQSNGETEGGLVEQLDYGNAEIEGLNNGHDYPWYGYGYGYGNGRLGGYDYDKKIVAQTQYGYGPDGADYCESIFGYWPCLAKKNKKMNGIVQENADKISGCDQGTGYDLCKVSAEYIFGSSLGCGEPIAGDHANKTENYYIQKPSYAQEMYYDNGDQNSWIQKFSIF